MGRIFATHAMVGIAMCMYIYANIDTNTYTNTYANFIDCKGGAAAGRPPLLVYSIGICIGICIGVYICIYVYVVCMVYMVYKYVVYGINIYSIHSQ